MASNAGLWALCLVFLSAFTLQVKSATLDCFCTFNSNLEKGILPVEREGPYELQYTRIAVFCHNRAFMASHHITSFHTATLGGGAYAIWPVGLTYAPPPLPPAVVAVLLPTFCSSSILSSSRVFISRSSCPTTQQQQHHPLKQSVAMSPSIPYALRTRPRCSAANSPCSPQASAKSPHAPLQASYPSRLVGSSPANFRFRRCCVLP